MHFNWIYFIECTQNIETDNFAEVHILSGILLFSNSLRSNSLKRIILLLQKRFIPLPLVSYLLKSFSSTDRMIFFHFLLGNSHLICQYPFNLYKLNSTLLEWLCHSGIPGRIFKIRVKRKTNTNIQVEWNKDIPMENDDEIKMTISSGYYTQGNFYSLSI